MDDTHRLQRLLDVGTGIVTFPDGEFQLSRPLVISDGTRLVCSPRTYLKLADGADCPMIRNRDKGREMTRHVSIEGGVWDGNNLAQHRNRPGDELIRKYSEALGEKDFFNPLIWFSFVEDLCLRGMTLKDPESYAVELTGAARFTVADITFDFNLQRPNMDGIHINGFARDGHITNVKGSTNDDLVALNADEGGFLCDDCDIRNITIDGVYGGDNGWTGVRLLSRSAKVRSIMIRNVFGAYRYNAVSFTHWARGAGDHGWFEDIALDGIFASSTRKSGEGHGGLIWFQPGVRHVGAVTIDRVMRIDAPDAFNTVHTVDVPDDVRIESLTLGRVQQRVPDGKEAVRIGRGATIGRLHSP